MVADIEMADRPHDDPDYMEDAIQNMIDDGSQYCSRITTRSCKTIRLSNKRAMPLSNKRAMRLSNNLSCNKKEIPARYVNVNIYNASLTLGFRLTWLSI